MLKKIELHLLLVLSLSFLLIRYVDKKLNILLDNYLNMEVKRLTTNVVNKSVKDVLAKQEYDDLIIVSKKENSEINKIEYNTKKINILTNDILNKVQQNIKRLDSGQVDSMFLYNQSKNMRFNKIEKGIVLDVSLGNIYHSSLFANIGPTIPIKLVFSLHTNVDIDLKTKEYGINNIMVEIDAVVTVKEITTMPISSKQKTIKVRSPISIDIIKGNIPENYFKMFQ